MICKYSPEATMCLSYALLRWKQFRRCFRTAVRAWNFRALCSCSTECFYLLHQVNKLTDRLIDWLKYPQLVKNEEYDKRIAQKNHCFTEAILGKVTKPARKPPRAHLTRKPPLWIAPTTSARRTWQTRITPAAVNYWKWENQFCFCRPCPCLASIAHT